MCTKGRHSVDCSVGFIEVNLGNPICAQAPEWKALLAPPGTHLCLLDESSCIRLFIDVCKMLFIYICFFIMERLNYVLVESIFQYSFRCANCALLMCRGPKKDSLSSSSWSFCSEPLKGLSYSGMGILLICTAVTFTWPDYRKTVVWQALRYEIQ